MRTVPFDAGPVLDGLTGFQRATVAHVMDRFFGSRPTRRFLTADETGLGKSLVARGVIASTIERLQHDDEIDRIDIVYICSNTDIAEQNISRLNVTGEEALPFASRLTLLAKEARRLQRPQDRFLKPVNLVSFTPGTSFQTGHAGGKAAERALLHILLTEILDLNHRDQRRARVALAHTAGPVSFERSVATMHRHLSDEGPDPVILNAFETEARRRRLLPRFERLLEEIGQRRTIGTHDVEWDECRELIGAFRTALAKASVDTLQPDLVILDEFQRFRHLLARDESDAAELAHDLFDHSTARVLLLSATPYKPFTYAEEAGDGDDHRKDFLATLRFLASEDEATVGRIDGQLVGLRAAAGRDIDPTEITGELRSSLLDLMCRTERPQFGVGDMLHEPGGDADDLRPGDLVDLAALRAVADAIDAPFGLDYWKSAPYFVNFMHGYGMDTALREALKDPTRARDLAPLLTATQHLDPAEVRQHHPIEYGNARLRRLAAETVDQGWAELLWMPPSLAYLAPGGPFARAESQSITKRLVFSSWTATPTAVAALLSHNAQQPTAGAARSIATRLDFRMDDDRPGAMTTLALFWPNPALAPSTDPLAVAGRSEGDPMAAAAADGEVLASLPAPIGPDGFSHAQQAEAWLWIEPFRLEGAVLHRTEGQVTQATLALAGSLPTPEGDHDGDEQEPRRLRRHIEAALGAGDHEGPSERPADLRSTLAQIGLHGPGNVAWRALGRQLGTDHQVTPIGHWTAAATIASAFRSLFNRPDTAALLDRLYPGVTYWRAVLRYCADGNLQAVLDEYLHHLAHDRGPDPFDDGTLLATAAKVRDAIAMRPAPYTAFDPGAPETPIRFSARFALRYGNKQQTSDDVRQPAIRNAFNSPFWPFVLATTSVGQEGIDLHWWCHAVLHWNTPSNPVDFDQREGRVHRYGGHAIRKNVAARHREAMLSAAGHDPWEVGYEAAQDRTADLGELAPYWVYPGPAKILRYTSPYPLSIDRERLRRLKDDVALYRLTLGQPRQEDLLDLLRRKGVATDPERAASLRLDLTPPGGLALQGAAAISESP